MRRSLFARSLAAGAAAGAVAAAGITAGAAGTPTVPSGYHLSTFATGSAVTNPDSVTSGGGHIYIGYQNAAASDGSSGSSTIIEYTMTGTAQRTWTVPGKNDGLRYNKFDGKLWATRNEDGNPALTIIDLASGTATDYAFPSPAHGGGYDDLAFTRDRAFIVASNPTNAGAHVPAVLKVTSLSGGTVGLEPILYDDSTATDRASGKPVQLELSDPDSLWLTATGELALTAQGDAQMVFMKNPGQEDQVNEMVDTTTGGQAEQLDDTAFATSNSGFFLVVDQKAGATYKLTHDGGFQPGLTLSEAPNDSTVPSVVGTFNTHTGELTTISTGWIKPTGLLFVATGDDGQDESGDQGSE